MYEEAGVRCDRSKLKFVASQSWAFPRSMMMGVIVEAEDDSDNLSVAEDELADAKWFEREYLKEALLRQGDSDEPPEPGAMHVPSRISLARTLIDAWLAEGSESQRAHSQ